MRPRSSPAERTNGWRTSQRPPSARTSRNSQTAARQSLTGSVAFSSGDSSLSTNVPMLRLTASMLGCIDPVASSRKTMSATPLILGRAEAADAAMVAGTAVAAEAAGVVVGAVMATAGVGVVVVMAGAGVGVVVVMAGVWV